MHAEEWIEKHGRYMRQIGATELRKKLNRQKGECTWCGKKVKANSRRWCSDECQQEGYLRNGYYLVSLVNGRDNGVCAICGLETNKICKRLQHLRWRLSRVIWDRDGENYRQLKCRMWCIPLLHRIARHRLGTPDFESRCYEIDHVTPVIEGGGLCGLDGFRTLCIRCHKEETAKLAKRRASKRKTQKQRTLQGQLFE